MRSYGLDALDRAGLAGEKGEKPTPDVGPNDVEAFLKNLVGVKRNSTRPLERARTSLFPMLA